MLANLVKCQIYIVYIGWLGSSQLDRLEIVYMFRPCCIIYHSIPQSSESVPSHPTYWWRLTIIISSQCKTLCVFVLWCGINRKHCRALNMLCRERGNGLSNKPVFPTSSYFNYCQHSKDPEAHVSWAYLLLPVKAQPTPSFDAWLPYARQTDWPSVCHHCLNWRQEIVGLFLPPQLRQPTRRVEEDRHEVVDSLQMLLTRYVCLDCPPHDSTFVVDY